MFTLTLRVDAATILQVLLRILLVVALLLHMH